MDTCVQRNSKKWISSYARLTNNEKLRLKTPDNKLEMIEVSLNLRRAEADLGKIEQVLWKKLDRNIYIKIQWRPLLKIYIEALQQLEYNKISYNYLALYQSPLFTKVLILAEAYWVTSVQMWIKRRFNKRSTFRMFLMES